MSKIVFFERKKNLPIHLTAFKTIIFRKKLQKNIFQINI